MTEEKRKELLSKLTKEISIENLKNFKSSYLSDLKIDFLPDRGLIIGTDEYKKKIDDLIFNDLISKKICSRECFGNTN